MDGNLFIWCNSPGAGGVGAATPGWLADWMAGLPGFTLLDTTLLFTPRGSSLLYPAFLYPLYYSMLVPLCIVLRLLYLFFSLFILICFSVLPHSCTLLTLPLLTPTSLPSPHLLIPTEFCTTLNLLYYTLSFSIPSFLCLIQLVLILFSSTFSSSSSSFLPYPTPSCYMLICSTKFQTPLVSLHLFFTLMVRDIR